MTSQQTHPPPQASSSRKDLQDLRKLARSPIRSYLRKHAAPRRPRSRAAALAPSKYPVLAAFAPTRLAWIWDYLLLRLGPRYPFQVYTRGHPDQGVYKLAGDERQVRIALAGDWATGTDEAEFVSQLIEAFKPHYSIHLGDVYYYGGPDEVGENFLGIKNPWNGYAPCQWPKGSEGSFALNGNHEMYARGRAYFTRMLPKLGLISHGSQRGQKASFFCLENEHWRIIALDTGYNSLGWPIVEHFHEPACALRPEQIEWLRNVVRPQPDDPRGIILLTHHQYYSRYDYWYTAQAKQLTEFFSRPVLWFWGHEHRMAIYPEYGLPGYIRAFGRCIGHGGMPIDLPPAKPMHPDFPVEFVDPRHYPNDENLTVGYNGFARLTLKGERMEVHYVDVHGKTIFSEEWLAGNGTVQRIHAQCSVQGASAGLKGQA